MTASLISNIAALKAARKLNSHATDLSRVFERLASGQRITRAVDDAAGLAIASRLDTNVRVYTQAVRNGNDAISSLSIADGAIGSLKDVLIRLRELSTQAANGGVSLAQRKAMDAEAKQLTDEYNRIVTTTEFNGVNITAGGQSTTRIQLGFGTDGSIGYILGEELDRNVSTGAYQTGVSFASFDIANFSGAFDFNADGKDDIIGRDKIANGTYILKSNGDGTFSATNLVTGGSDTGAAAADFDGNGTLDVVVGGSGGLDFFSGNGNGSFGSAVAVGTSATPDGVVQAGDFNGDGKQDVLYYDGANVLLSTGNGNGTFSSGTVVGTAGGNINDLDIGDFNADSNLDFVISNSTNTNVQVYSGSGTGGFANNQTITGTAGSASAVGDINHDGYDDIVNQAGTLTSYLSGPGGSFGSGQTIAGITVGPVFHLADMNGDGALDIAGALTTTFSLATGRDDGTFNTANTTSVVNMSSGSVIGDFNGDGVRDIAGGRTNPSTTSTVYMAQTQSTTSIQRLYLLDAEGARAAMSIIDEALNRASSEQGKIGANMSRISSALANLQSLRDNNSAASSRITGADIAEESAQAVRLQTLERATAAVLAQANQSGDFVLELLKPPR